MLTLHTAIREIVTSDRETQHYEDLHLTGQGFRLEKGVWVRRKHFEPRGMELVWEIPEVIVGENFLRNASNNR